MLKVIEPNSSETKTKETFFVFEEIFSSHKFFSLLGQNVLFDSRPDKNVRFRRANFWVAKPFIILIFFACVMGIYRFLAEGNIIRMLENICYLGMLASFAMKFRLIFLKQEAIRRVVAKLREHFPSSRADQKRFDVNGQVKVLKRISAVTMAADLSLQYAMFTLPAFTQLFGWLTSQQIPLEPPIVVFYPYDMTNMLNYFLSASVTVWVLNTEMWLFLSADLLYNELMTLTIMEIGIVGLQMSEIEPLNDEEQAMKEVTRLVGLHNELIKVVDDLDDFFAPILLVEMLTFIIMISSSVFALVSFFYCEIQIKFLMKSFPITQAHLNVIFLIKGFFVLSLAFCNGFKQCWLGQKLIE